MPLRYCFYSTAILALASCIILWVLSYWNSSGGFVFNVGQYQEDQIHITQHNGRICIAYNTLAGGSVGDVPSSEDMISILGKERSFTLYEFSFKDHIPHKWGDPPPVGSSKSYLAKGVWIPYWAILLTVLLCVSLFSWKRVYWRLSKQRCSGCGYLLLGIAPESACPECGAARHSHRSTGGAGG